jgi:cation diffusion facilitator CzcD-associated flavoprotein CzcO
MVRSSVISSSERASPQYDVIVVGAGFSGLGAGIKLKEAGIDNFIILESAHDLGGTWRDNTYPGIAVDITSFSYSYSFEQNPFWSRVFAPGQELQAYAQHCAQKYGLTSHFRFRCRVKCARFDQARHMWRIELENGETFTTRYLISATGGLTQPKMPDIPGIATFKGKIMHTARWDHGYDMTNQRVAIIGTGATAVQLVPTIAPSLKQLYVYQRTPIWIVPKPDRGVPPLVQQMFHRVPGMQSSVRLAAGLATEMVMVFGVIYNKQLPNVVKRLEALCLRHLEKQVPDPVLREKLTPKYGFGCKRPSFSSDFYLAFNRPNVELVTEGIERIEPTGILTKDGQKREIDTLICATGFKVFERGNLPSYEVWGRDDLELADFWDQNRYQAYEGATVAGFPNYFMVLGPYSTTGASWFSMVEAQVNHALRCILEARKRGATRIEVKQEAHDAFFADILKRQTNTVFFNNNCATSNSYYFDKHGDAPFLRPASGLELWWRSRHFPLNDYQFGS